MCTSRQSLGRSGARLRGRDGTCQHRSRPRKSVPNSTSADIAQGQALENLAALRADQDDVVHTSTSTSFWPATALNVIQESTHDDDATQSSTWPDMLPTLQE